MQERTKFRPCLEEADAPEEASAQSELGGGGLCWEQGEGEERIKQGNTLRVTDTHGCMRR